MCRKKNKNQKWTSHVFCHLIKFGYSAYGLSNIIIEVKRVNLYMGLEKYTITRRWWVKKSIERCIKKWSMVVTMERSLRCIFMTILFVVNFFTFNIYIYIGVWGLNAYCSSWILILECPWGTIIIKNIQDWFMNANNLLSSC